MKILEYINKFRLRPSCRVYEPCGLPKVAVPDILPNDVVLFYTECGGIDFYVDIPFGCQILAPSLVVPTIENMYGANWRTEFPESLSPKSESFYNILFSSCHRFSINLGPQWNGYIFDSTDSSAGTEESNVIAKSLTEMLEYALSDNADKLFCEISHRFYGDLGDLIQKNQRIG
jgi:hypothetical protein